MSTHPVLPSPADPDDELADQPERVAIYASLIRTALATLRPAGSSLGILVEPDRIAYANAYSVGMIESVVRPSSPYAPIHALLHVQAILAALAAVLESGASQ